MPIAALWSPENCPASHLAWLAWALKVDVWSPGWSDAQKRAAIRTSIDAHRRKGTVSAVRIAVARFGAGLAIREWWQKIPAGTPHTFEVTLTIADSEDSSVATQAEIVAAIETVKPVRSHFTVVLGRDAAGSLALFGAGRPIIYRRIQTVEA